MARDTRAFRPGIEMAGLVIGGDLVIQRPLAEGGMGAVFVALQKSTGKERALKLMHREIAADPAFQKRFEQEARVGARIRSEHVVEVLGAGVDGPTGLPYLVMELLEGENLRHRLARSALSFSETRAVLEQLCHAMAAAHAAGVIHRDLKPENVFLAHSRRAGAGPFTVKVLDFGIAKIVIEAATHATRGAVGSPLWMAPEQTKPGPVTSSADVWAIGLVTYEMLVGKSFWRTAHVEDGTTIQLLREIALDPLPPASVRAAEQGHSDRLPPGFDAWFARCVCREPAARFPDASALWRALPGPLASALPDAHPTEQADALAATHAASRTPSSPPVRPVSANDTGPATAFVEPDRGPQLSAPVALAPSALLPREPPALGPETPIATVHEPAASLPQRSGWRGRAVPVIAAAAVGVAAFSLLRSRPLAGPAMGPPSSPPSAVENLPSAVGSSVPTSVTIAPSREPSASAPLRPSSAPASAAQPGPSAAIVVSSSAAVPNTKPIARSAGGFSDPTDRNGPVTWKVQDRHVRLFVRLVSNETNVADAVVRRGIEWSSWEYLRCYERVFGAAKDLPEGTVSVGFDVLDQLPRHAAIDSSTFTSDMFNDCIVRTLIGRTLNAAGPDGLGHAVEGFRFVPN